MNLSTVKFIVTFLTVLRLGQSLEGGGGGTEAVSSTVGIVFHNQEEEGIYPPPLSNYVNPCTCMDMPL